MTNPSEQTAAAHPVQSLRSRASQGAVLSLLGQGGAQVLRLLGNLILARLLFPEAFGLMAIVYLVVFALEQFSNIGIPAAIMRYERGEEAAFQNTAWTIQLLRGVALWLVGLALTPVVSGFYRQPELMTILPVATFAAVIMGFTSTKYLVLMRRLELARRISIELIGRIVALVTMIGIAWVQPTVWALVIGGLANQVAIVILSHVWVPGARNRFAWEKQAVNEIFSLGKWVFASSGLSFVLAQMDVALLGRLVTAGMLGVYSMGIIIPNLLRDIAFTLSNSVLAPVVAESNRESPGMLRERYASARRLTLPAALTMALAAAVVSPTFFGVLYDDRYADASWISQLALVRFWFAYLQVSSCMTLLSIGDGRTWAISNLAGLVGVTTGCLVGFELAEMPGLLVGMGIGSTFAYVVPAIRLQRMGIASPLPELGWSAAGVLLAVASLGGAHVSGAWLPLADPWRTLVVGSLVLAPFALWVGLRVLREFRLR